MGIFRFAFKVSLAGGAVYYLKEQGVWKDSNETTKLYGKICEVATPYVEQAKSQLPVELPQLPKTDRTSYVMKQYWNKGVLASFKFLGDLPGHIDTWSKQGVDAVMSNEGIKDFVNSFSSTPQPAPEPVKK